MPKHLWMFPCTCSPSSTPSISRNSPPTKMFRKPCAPPPSNCSVPALTSKGNCGIGSFVIALAIALEKVHSACRSILPDEITPVAAHHGICGRQYYFVYKSQSHCQQRRGLFL